LNIIPMNIICYLEINTPLQLIFILESFPSYLNISKYKLFDI
jgi:hypothetical protein